MTDIERLRFVLVHIDKADTLETDLLENLTSTEQEVVRNLYEENLVAEALIFLDGLDTDEEWKKVKKKMAIPKKQIVPFWKPIIRYAAIFAGCIIAGYLVYTNRGLEPQKTISETAIKLKTGDGETKVIQESGSQKIISNSGLVIGKRNGSTITYSPNDEIDKLIFNELEIPYGKVFNVVLSDGTLVHLNSGTTMRYPVQFLNQGRREIFIEGEAYFKVAEDALHPFIVHANEVSVEALGTEFNVSSYTEDAEIRTVLVKGSVEITNPVVPENTVVLVPGTKGAYDKKAQNIDVESVDANLYTGWIKGELIFRNVSFGTMEKKLERSYNVRIQNNNNLLRDRIFNARFSVEIESIEDVLNAISEIYPFTFNRQGQQIIIN